MQSLNLLQRLPALAVSGLLTLGGLSAARSADSAVILMYHRFGEDGFRSTNIKITQFEDHIRTLASGPYTVLPVAEIVAALREGRELPDRTVGITIDDAYRSVYTEAFPRLKAAGLPFTLFVSTDSVDRGLSGFLTWDQIREVRDAGNDIGAHSASHLHMTEASAETNRAEMTRSLQRFKEELGTAPALFAYPYGEASLAVWNVVREFGFTTAFGQHSGAAHTTSLPYYLPRFALTEDYGDPENFVLRINTKGLPVEDVTPEDPELRDRNPPLVGFTVGSAIPSLLGFACYHSQFGEIEFTQLGRNRVEIRFPSPLASGRTRLNCTKPADEGRWYWYGMQFYVPAE